MSDNLSYYLVKNDPLQVPDDITAVVEHGAEDLRGHNEAGGGGVDLDITGNWKQRTMSRVKPPKNFISKYITIGCNYGTGYLPYHL